MQYQSYSVQVLDGNNTAIILSIPCSGGQIADCVYQNLSRLFPHHTINKLSNQIIAQPSAHEPNIIAFMDSELEKDLFA